MTFDEIVTAVESMASEPRNLRSLLYILITSDKAGSTIGSTKAPMQVDLLPLADASHITAELVAEFHETQRVAQARARNPRAPIVE